MEPSASLKATSASPQRMGCISPMLAGVSAFPSIDVSGRLGSVRGFNRLSRFTTKDRQASGSSPGAAAALEALHVSGRLADVTFARQGWSHSR